jgi:hypothetical protein
MNVETKAASFKVDWKRVWAESGRRSPNYLKNYMRQKNRSKVDNAIKQIARNGDYMMALNTYVGTKRSPVAELATQEMYQRNSVETNVANMPSSMPDVTWDPGYVRIEWSTGEVQIEWDDAFMPDVKVKPHSVEIRLTGRAEVKISLDEKRVAHISGKKVNRKI